MQRHRQWLTLAAFLAVIGEYAVAASQLLGVGRLRHPLELSNRRLLRGFLAALFLPRHITSYVFELCSCCSTHASVIDKCLRNSAA